MAMEKRILIDLNDKSNWLYESTSPPTASGVIVEENRVILMPEGEHRLFAFTDAVMHYAEDSTGGEHIHHSGYETFFVDSGHMDFYSMGQYCEVKKGDILHQPAHISHGMVFHEDTRYRGIFQDWSIIDDFDVMYELKRRSPEVAANMPRRGFDEPPEQGKTDFTMLGKFNCVKVPPEQMYAVRNPSRPLHKFEFDGVTLKLMIGRWEIGGVRETWRVEMKKGFCADWDIAPPIADLFYVTEGKIKFTVYGEEYTAYEDCLVKIPKFAPRSFVAETDAAMYDLGGLPYWYEFLHDYTGMLQQGNGAEKDTEKMNKLKKRTNVYVKSFGMK